MRDYEFSQPRPLHVPVAPGEYVTIWADFPLTEEKWQQMFAVLSAMKAALVEAGADELRDDASDGKE
jgi:diadenosine tetraphosphate (Ap4A) HIT family hydrolase